MQLHIDPDSPVPLYHQIAEAIRRSIESGRLAPGDALEPMRQAAERWGVNIHTVRHAYAALARDGLIERHRGRRGTRVLALQSRREDTQRDLDAFLERVTREGRERFGLGVAELVAVLEDHARARTVERPVVYVVECSAWQCESHAREIRERFDVEARAWPLDRQEPPDGPMISTYFHYNDIRRRWPRRLGRVRFITIYPDPGLRQRLEGVRRVLVCERAPSTAEAIAADLSALFPPGGLEVMPLVVEDPARTPLGGDSGPPVLFAPRVWAALDTKLRQHPRTLELRYVLDEEELGATARALGWQARKGAVA